MAIRYFATNRSLTDLGRAVSARNRRLQLQRGGYYFVDMNRYMAHYLGEVEADTMPVEAIVGNDREATGSSADVIFGDNFLRHPKVGRVVVCVHGFNVELFEAFTWFRILTDSMRHVNGIGERIATCPTDISAEMADGSMTAFIGFSWPSDGRVLSYLSDQSEARATAPVLGNLLVRLKALGKPVSLVCHSMGNYVACHTLKGLVNEEFVPLKVSRSMKKRWLDRGAKEKETEQVRRDDWLIDVFVMLAPDVERRHITKAKGRGVESTYVGLFYSGLQHLVRRNVNVYSRYDSVLRISDIEKSTREAGIGILSKITLGLLDFRERNPDYRWEKRLGEAPHPVSAPPNFTSVNAIEVAGRPIDHSDHIDDTDIAQKIASALEI